MTRDTKIRSCTPAPRATRRTGAPRHNAPHNGEVQEPAVPHVPRDCPGPKAPTRRVRSELGSELARAGRFGAAALAITRTMMRSMVASGSKKKGRGPGLGGVKKNGGGRPVPSRGVDLGPFQRH